MVDEAVLTNRPNLVLLAVLKTRDTILIDQSELAVQVVFDGRVFVTILGMRISHLYAEKMIGRPVGDLLELSQLSDHPVMAMTMDSIEPQEDGLEIKLAA